MPKAWNEDPPGAEQQILENAAAVLREIADAAGRRLEPSVSMAREWRRRLYRGVPLPVPCYAGEPRDSDPACPELQGYGLAAMASMSGNRLAAVAAFDQMLRAVIREEER